MEKIRVSGDCIHCGKHFDVEVINMVMMGIPEDADYDCCPDCSEKRSAEFNSAYKEAE